MTPAHAGAGAASRRTDFSGVGDSPGGFDDMSGVVKNELVQDDKKKEINGVSGNLKFAENQSDEFKSKINSYIKKIASTDIGYEVLYSLIYTSGIVTISEVRGVLESVTTADAITEGDEIIITGNSTIAVSTATLFHDGAFAQGITTFSHEIWHAFQMKMGSEAYIALQTVRDGLHTRYSEIQAVGFENYIRATLNINTGPRLHYTTRDSPLNNMHGSFSAPINLYKKPGKYWGNFWKSDWDVEDFRSKSDVWRNLHLSAIEKNKKE